ncbi:uncharacterized protein LOC107414927 isoform X1 [Ziziphus jujuba]|uniref:Uncharacterized protein LOC107414927 isoform X1 n=1 Tax=Ziziphus jujuba TaxID=326968 RepID=A0A6P3ZIN3_ZIZJJ|nr:uncharacterized protein LOC107414927 isoform X1 [Ziziphus jujuba]
MDLLPCPFCNLNVPSSQLQWHANNHFEDEQEQQQLDTDLELAQQLALASPSPPPPSQEQQQLDTDLELAQQLALSPPSPPPPSQKSQMVSDLRSEMGWYDGNCGTHEKIACLIALQTRSNFYRIEGGLMTLLRNCLELEAEDTTSILSGYVDHFQSIESEDVGWGCGWRNIQMLSSHLLMQRQEAREVLFGGSGFIPDIPSLQRWLEIAWEKGFDVAGSEQFGNRIYGLKKWIGTTECAALFRSFGFLAVIVDFGPKEYESLYPCDPSSSSGAEVKRIYNGGKKKAVKVHGPMDRYLLQRNCDIDQAFSCGNEMSTYSGRGNTLPTKSEGQHVLTDWVWNYFSDKSSVKSYNRHVILSEKTPLYFQHDGHSRTIVGIQVRHQRNGMQQYSLLVLDPGHRTVTLERSLREKAGWQTYIKRGVHTLRKQQYQLCYIDPGIASGRDIELLKTIDSAFIEL